MFYWPLQQNSPIITTTWFECVFVLLMIPFEAVLSQLQTTSQESHHFRKTNSPSLEAIDLLMSFFQSPTLHLPLWVVSSASEIRFLYIYLCSLNQNETWQNGFNGTVLLTELMISTVCTPKKWLLDTDIVSWFALLPSLNLSTIALSESSNPIQPESFIITCTVFH